HDAFRSGELFCGLLDARRCTDDTVRRHFCADRKLPEVTTHAAVIDELFLAVAERALAGLLKNAPLFAQFVDGRSHAQPLVDLAELLVPGVAHGNTLLVFVLRRIQSRRYTQ